MRNGTHWLVLALVSVGCFLVVNFWHELQFTSAQQHVQFLLFYLLLVSSVAWSKTDTVIKKRAKSLFFISFALYSGFLVAHFALNALNIYQLLTLPPLFYTLKLHRLISLSPLFLIQNLFLLAGCFFAVRHDETQLKVSAKNIGGVVIGLFLAGIILTQIQQSLAQVYRDVIQVSVNIETEFDDRFAYRLGGNNYYGWIWPYTRFINKHTEPDAVIAIPPQSVVWKMEGNADYLRWFIYPRRMVKEELDGSMPEEAEYALISIGECALGDCGWPRVSIPSEEIEYMVLIDRVTQEEQIITNSGYELNTDRFIWGIIKLK